MLAKVGIEEEFHIVDPTTGYLASAAPDLLAKLPSCGTFTDEASATCVETNSAPYVDLSLLRADLVRSRTQLVQAAATLGLGVMACGTAPLMDLEDVGRTPGVRYDAVLDDYAAVGREWVTCGLHVHVEVDNRDHAAVAIGWIAPQLPTLLALTAGSPFWSGRDTGYASWRHVLAERLPTAGVTGRFRSADEYDDLMSALLLGGIIRQDRMFYPAVRLSSHAPTLELRIGDAVADVEVAILVGALFRALVTRGTRAAAAGVQSPEISPMLLRGAIWRASRWGLEHELIDPSTARTAPAIGVVRALVEQLSPELRQSGDYPRVVAAVDELAARGGAASEQRAAAARAGGPKGAVDHVLARTMELVSIDTPWASRAELAS